MTKVICSACGDECEVPFKPQTDKPLFCSDCFSKQENGSSRSAPSRGSNLDMEKINKKLDKIMKALEIE